jgi:hypothetical protein
LHDATGFGQDCKLKSVQLDDRMNEAQPQPESGRGMAAAFRSIKASGDEVALGFRNARTGIADTQDVLSSVAAELQFDPASFRGAPRGLPSAANKPTRCTPHRSRPGYC